MSSTGRRAERSLTAEQRYDLWVRMLPGLLTTVQAAAEAGVDRTTIAALKRVARDGAITAWRRRVRAAQAHRGGERLASHLHGLSIATWAKTASLGNYASTDHGSDGGVCQWEDEAADAHCEAVGIDAHADSPGDCHEHRRGRDHRAESAVGGGEGATRDEHEKQKEWESWRVLPLIVE
jgi:hypothetical protein